MKKEDIQELCSNDDASVDRRVYWPTDFDDNEISLKNLSTPRYSKPNLTLIIREGIKEIPKDLLSNSGCFSKVCIPASVEKIGAMAFYMSTISEVEIADESVLTEIGDGAFAGTSISTFCGEKVKIMGSQAFMNCTNLQNAVFPSLKSVPALAFAGSNNLTDINIESACSIGARAFYECGLTAFVAPPQLTEIGPFAFCNGNLETVDLSAAYIEVLEMGVFKGNAIHNLKLPCGWEMIKSQAFQDNELENLEGITISFEGVISGDAFDKGVI